MDFEVTEQQKAFMNEVSNWLDKELTPELREEFERDMAYVRIPVALSDRVLEFNRKLGAKGWIGIHWPKEYGGGGRSVIDQLIIIDELASRYAMIANCQALMIVPSLLANGTEEQKMEVIPKVARGEIEVGLGYSEPEAGSDLSNIGIRAVQDGDYYLINGKKKFNTGIHWASYHWLAARTDPNAVPKHKGITMFLVDMKTPGITVEPLHTIDDARTNMVYYDNVRVPKKCIVGQKNKGFYVMMGALDEERLLIFSPRFYGALLKELVKYTKETFRDGELLCKNPIIRQKLAKLDVEIECGTLLYHKAIWMVDNRIPATVETAIYKLFMSETGQRFVTTAKEIIGTVGQLRRNSKWACLRGLIELGQRATIFHTFGGGTSEIMRDIIALRGCNLPHV